MIDKAKLKKYLKKLRNADHIIASMPEGSERASLQELIGKKIDKLQKFLQVENRKGSGPARQSLPHNSRPDLDAKAPSTEIRADGFRAGPLFFL